MLIMCINSHNFGINNTKSYAFLFKDGYDCPLLWRAPKIKPPTIFCVRRSFFFGEADFLFISIHQNPTIPLKPSSPLSLCF